MLLIYRQNLLSCCFGSLFCCGLCFSGCCLFGASLAAALAGSLGCCFSFCAFAGCFGVNLFSLTLFETFGDSAADSAEDYLYALVRVVVGGDDVVNAVGIGVRINDTEHGNTEALSLAHFDVCKEHIAVR